MTRTFLLIAVICASAIGFETQANGNERFRNETEPECENLHGPDSLKTRQQTSLYREEFKRGNYIASVPYWRYVYQNAPCYKEFITADGSYLMSVLIQQTDPKDTKKIKAYADTLIQIYKTRLRLFGENYEVMGSMGSDMFTYFPEKRMEAIGYMKKSLERRGNSTDPTVLTNLMLAYTQQNRADGKVSEEEVIQMFESISMVVDHNLKTYKTEYKTSPAGDSARVGQYMRYWEWVENYVVAVATPYLTCEKLTEIYTPKFKAAPNDKELVEKIITLLKRAPNCAKTDFYLLVAEKNLELNPSADAAAALAKAYQEKDNLGKAKGFFEKAAELEEDTEKKKTYYIILGGIELSNGSCAQARTYANKALSIDPNSGEAYLIIGNAYMTCGSSCGTNEVEKAYPYLAAYDKFAKAKTVDPSVASRANKYMASAKARFPKTEDVFFRNIPKGSTVTTGCWIGESTIVRTRD